MKYNIMILIGIFTMVACSPLPGKNRTQSVFEFQQGNEFTSNSPTSIRDSDATSIPSFFEAQPDNLALSFNESPSDRQDLITDQDLPAANVNVAVNASSVALLQEIYNLIEQRHTDLIPTTSGWLHLITRRTIPQENSSLAGEQIQQEKWLLLDSEGKVRAEVMRNLKNQQPVDDFSLWESSPWFIVDLATTNKLSSTLPFDPNYGIYKLFDSIAKQGYVLNKSILYKECWYLGEKYTASNGEIVHEVLFRPDYHSLRWIKTWKLSSGAIILIDSLEIILEEHYLLPPDEVLALVRQTVP